jgi:hypothetical protein
MAHIKKIDTPKTDLNAALYGEVISALEHYQSWASGASSSGSVSPVQFLAVVLWAVGHSKQVEQSEAEERTVVAEWWVKLSKATALRVAQLGGHGPFRLVYPLDAVTRLEREESQVTSPHGWCMAVANADEWLEYLGHSAWCSRFFEACGLSGKVVELEVSKGEPVGPASVKHKTFSDLVQFRKDYPKSDWTTEQKTIAKQEAYRRKAKAGAKGVAKAMAHELGVTVTRFNELLRKAGDSSKRQKAA